MLYLEIQHHKTLQENPIPQKQPLVLDTETQRYEAPQKKYHKKKIQNYEKKIISRPSFYYTLYTTFDNFQQ